MASTAVDTDWIAMLYDEAPDGSLEELTRGWLRSSHRAVDPNQGRPNQPWHPHNQVDLLTPDQPEELPMEIVATCRLFAAGHRLRLELANCDNLPVNNFWYRRTLIYPATNRVLHGRGKSRIVLPVIPR
jgi:predicted acyl esterase